MARKLLRFVWGAEPQIPQTGDEIMRIKWMLLTVAALLALSADAHAQQPTAADVTGELRLIASQPMASDTDRATVRAFLDRTDVAQAAESHGIGLDAVKDRTSTLSDAEAAELAARIDAWDGTAQVGGDVIVISTTAIIIALLVLILLSVD
jgi:hypothetical protein